MIEFKDVSFGYSKEDIVKSISFTIDSGEFVAIVGPNGAGKSTISKLFIGLNKARRGTVVINGFDARKTKSSVLAKHIGFLFQNPDRQLCRNTIREEILFGLGCISDDKEKNSVRTEEILSEFGFDGNSAPFSMSRGERQRIALASLIAVKPEILILDEPTTGLDYKECMQIMNIISELNGNGTTVVMVCHDMELVNDFAKRVLVVSGGELIADGKPAEIFRNAEILERASLLPPQIIGLSQLLGGNFSDVNNVYEMADKIASEKEVM